MSKALEIAKLVCWLVVIVAVVLFACFIRHLDNQLSSITVDVHQTLTNTNGSVDKFSTTLDALSAVVAQEHKAQTRQTEEFQKSIGDVHDLIIHTDMQLNGSKLRHVQGLLPQAQQFLDHTDTQLNTNLFPKTNEVIGHFDVASGAALSSFTTVATDLHYRIADPTWPILMERFNVLALHLDNIATHSDAMSADMQIAVHRLAAPPTKFHEFLDASWTVLRFGSLFATP